MEPSESKKPKPPLQLPKPERFKEFCELPDRSGFEIPSGEKFYFEADGGWYDEFGNYYNKDGVPTVRSESDEYEDVEEIEEPPVKRLDKFEGYEDEVIKEYVEGFEEKKEAVKEEEVPEVQETKVPVEPEEPVELRITNLKYNLPEKELLKFFEQSIKEKLDYGKIIHNVPKGFAEVILKSKKQADLLLTLNGKILEGREVRIKVAEKKEKEKGAGISNSRIYKQRLALQLNLKEMSLHFQGLSPEEEIHVLRLELQARNSELQKLRAVSEQQSFFLTQQLEEVKARETNIKSMNETIMQVLQDITNSNTKISTELQLKQFLEEHIRNMKQPRSSSETAEELRKVRQELDRLRTDSQEKIDDLHRERSELLARVQSLDDERSRLLVDLQNAKLSNKSIYDKLRLEYEKEISKLRSEFEEVQSRNDDRCNLELMKSQIKELTTQHLIEVNSLKAVLNETHGKLERVYDAYCELKEKNAQMKAVIQGFRLKEARLKDLLFERPPTEPEEDDLCIGFNLNTDISYSNSMGLMRQAKTMLQKPRLEYSSITNVLDAFSSQDILRVSPEGGLDRSPKTDRFPDPKEAPKSCLEYVKKRSLSQQLELKPEEFSKPFQLEQMSREKALREEDSAKKDHNDSMEEFRTKRDKSVIEYSDFMNRNKKKSQE